MQTNLTGSLMASPQPEAKGSHTPGPWTTDGWSVEAVASPFPFVVAIAADPDQEVRDPVSQAANARLIAAAPDLLEALYRLTTECELDGLNPKAGYDCWLSVARAAIAKATGA